MPVVDSHCHVALAWYEPVESLLWQMERNGVDHAILIQMVSQPNNAYLFECVRRYPGRFAPVVVIDTNRPDAADDLKRQADLGASGVRLRAAMQSPGDDPLAIWRTADRLHLPVSCLGEARDFASPELATIVGTFPGLPIVVEHLGGLKGPLDGPEKEQLARRIFDLARYPNVTMKIPGLGEFANRPSPIVEPFPFERPIPPYLDMAFAAFGASRLMWGSDYPPSATREGYRNTLAWPREQFASKSDAERARIFGDTALSVFPLR